MCLQCDIMAECPAALTPGVLRFSIEIFSPLKLCFATAIHNFKGLKITLICTTKAQRTSVSLI